MKIYDCFLFFNELDLLEIRLNELDEVVDYFVIVEGESTFQSKPKELFYEKNIEKYKKFLSKIIHVVIPSNKLSNGNPWDNERVSFDSIHLGIKNASDEDLIMISAIDEIPSIESIEKARNFNSTCKIIHQFFYFYLNTKYWLNDRSNTNWNGTCVTKYSSIKNREIRDWFDNTRNSAHGIQGGWHFSFLGDEKNAFTKVNSYSHSEYNNLDENFYKEKMENLKDPFNRNNVGFHSIEDISELPNYVQKNLKKFEKLIRK